MDDNSKDTALARLAELVVRRLDRLEDRLRGVEQDNGEIINLLIAVKAGLEATPADLLIAAALDADEAEDDEADSDGGEAGGGGPRNGARLH